MKIWLDDLRPAPWEYESARSVNEAKTLIREAMPSNCWTGWWSGRPFIPWRSIPRTPWAERIWRACWRGTGERSTGRKHNTRKKQNETAEKYKMK